MSSSISFLILKIVTFARECTTLLLLMVWFFLMKKFRSLSSVILIFVVLRYGKKETINESPRIWIVERCSLRMSWLFVFRVMLITMFTCRVLIMSLPMLRLSIHLFVWRSLVCDSFCALNGLVRQAGDLSRIIPTSPIYYNVPKEIWRMIDYIYKNGLYTKGLWIEKGISKRSFYEWL